MFKKKTAYIITRVVILLTALMRKSFLHQPPDLMKPIANMALSLTWKEDDTDEHTAVKKSIATS